MFVSDFNIQFTVLRDGVKCFSEMFFSFDTLMTYISENEVYYKNEAIEFYLEISRKDVKHCYTIYDIQSLTFFVSSYYSFVILIDKTSLAIVKRLNKKGNNKKNGKKES